jgi:hypothetical protein
VYDKEVAEEAEVDEEADLGNLENNQGGSEIEEEGGQDDDSFGDVGHMIPSSSGVVISASRLPLHELEAKINPLEWKTELERVEPKLKVGIMLVSPKGWQVSYSSTMHCHIFIPPVFLACLQY